MGFQTNEIAAWSDVLPWLEGSPHPGLVLQEMVPMGRIPTAPGQQLPWCHQFTCQSHLWEMFLQSTSSLVPVSLASLPVPRMIPTLISPLKALEGCPLTFLVNSISIGGPSPRVPYKGVCF